MIAWAQLQSQTERWLGRPETRPIMRASKAWFYVTPTAG